MKNKLLKKVRRKYHLYINGLGQEEIRIKCIIGYRTLSFHEVASITMDKRLGSKESDYILLLRWHYGKYRRKDRVRLSKKNNWNRIK